MKKYILILFLCFFSFYAPEAKAYSIHDFYTSISNAITNIVKSIGNIFTSGKNGDIRQGRDGERGVENASLIGIEEIKGSGNLINKEENILGITDIDARGIGRIVLIQDDKEFMNIEAEDNIMPYIKTSMRNNVLKIWYEKNTCFASTKPVRFTIHVKDLNDISIKGSMRIKSEKISTKHLTMSTSGSARITLDLNVDKLEVVGSGSSRLKLSGTAKKQILDLSGSIKFNGGLLKGNFAQINSTGSSRITLNVSEKITGSVYGSSIIKYKGQPIIDIDRFGSSKIIKE